MGPWRPGWLVLSWVGFLAEKNPVGVPRMNALRMIMVLRRVGGLVIAAASWWHIIGGAAWAQDTGQASGGGSPWIVAYAVALLGVVLGVLVVCAPSRRRERAMPEEYEISALSKALEAGRKAAVGPGATAPGVPGAPGMYQPGGFPGRFAPAAVEHGSVPCKEARNALWLSLIGLFCVFVAPVGLIQGLKARQLIHEDPRLSGEGQAIAAIVIGAAGVVLLLVGLVVGVLSVLSQ